MKNVLNVAKKNSERDRSRQSQVKAFIDFINIDSKQLKTFISRQRISVLFDHSANHQDQRKEKEVNSVTTQIAALKKCFICEQIRHVYKDCLNKNDHAHKVFFNHKIHQIDRHA